MIDLRSDTVTRPTPGMRAAIAAAEVGDDVFGDDPTINRLQAVLAERLGRPIESFVFPHGRFTPAAAKCRAASPIISPAPIMSAVFSERSAYMRRVRLTAADARETAFAPIWVSERTRLAA